MLTANERNTSCHPVKALVFAKATLDGMLVFAGIACDKAIIISTFAFSEVYQEPVYQKSWRSLLHRAGRRNLYTCACGA